MERVTSLAATNYRSSILNIYHFFLDLSKFHVWPNPPNQQQQQQQQQKTKRKTRIMLTLEWQWSLFPEIATGEQEKDISHIQRFKVLKHGEISLCWLYCRNPPEPHKTTKYIKTSSHINFYFISQIFDFIVIIVRQLTVLTDVPMCNLLEKTPEFTRANKYESLTPIALENFAYFLI